MSPSLYCFVREEKRMHSVRVSLNCTYTGQCCRYERPPVSVPVRSCPGARDPVAVDVTGSGRLPDQLYRDVCARDDERIAQILRRARRTID